MVLLVCSLWRLALLRFWVCASEYEELLKRDHVPLLQVMDEQQVYAHHYVFKIFVLCVDADLTFPLMSLCTVAERPGSQLLIMKVLCT